MKPEQYLAVFVVAVVATLAATTVDVSLLKPTLIGYGVEALLVGALVAGAVFVTESL